MRDSPVSVLRPAASAGLERVYREQATGLLRFLARRTGDAALAEDLLAETFVRVLRARRPYDPRLGAERTWLYAIALNCLREHWRHRAAEERALARLAAVDAGEPVAGPGAAEERASLAWALAGLSAVEREAVVLRFGADLRVADIAAVTGERLTTIGGRLHRALRKLRAELEPPELAAERLAA